MGRPRLAGKQPYRGVFIRSRPCGCGKRGYPDRKSAKDVIREMRRQGKVRTDRVDAYRCTTDDDFWHVGHRHHNEGRGNLNDPANWAKPTTKGDPTS